MAYGLRPSIDSKGRLRAQVTISLAAIALGRLKHMAKQQGTSVSRVIESLVGEVDYKQLFQLFAQRHTLANIVIATGQPPALVRALYEEFRADLYERERAEELATKALAKALPGKSAPKRLKALPP